MRELVLISAKNCHSKIIWELRNDPITRDMSINGKRVSWEEHSSWYEKFLIDNFRKIYIGEEMGVPIGLVRFEKHKSKKNSYDVSIIIYPKNRSKGFGKRLLINGIKRLVDEVENCKFIRAEVKKDNESSNKLFKSCGFTFVENESGVNNYELSLY